jgi:glycosyltransferase involved in cell wall biosynthesis
MRKIGIMEDLSSRLTVAMITKDEENAVGKVVGEIKQIAPKAEILIVDSSIDRTPEIAREMGARVIRQFPPQGYGPAMELALRSATREVVVTLDCDNTYPVDKIIPFARLIMEGTTDLVDGCRLRHKPRNMPWLNFMGNFIFAFLASILFARRIRDLHSGMRAYRKSMIDQLAFHAKGAALPVELLLKPMTQGFRVTFLDIDYQHRIGISKMNPLATSLWTLRRILSARFG